MFYGYSVAILNVVAIFFFSMASVQGEIPSLDAFSFGFLHAMAAEVMLPLVHQSQKLETPEEPA